MPYHHVKGQPAASTYVREKGVLLFTLIVQHPVGQVEQRCQARYLDLAQFLSLCDVESYSPTLYK